MPIANVDAPGNRRTTVYDAAARALASVAPDGGTVTSVYDAADQTIAMKGWNATVSFGQWQFGEKTYEGNAKEPPPHANHYTVVAVWASRAAYDAHETAAYTRQFRAATVMPARANMYDQRLYDLLK